MRGGIASVLGGWLAWLSGDHHPTIIRPGSRWDNKPSLPAHYLFQQHKDLPADALVEYLRPDLFGNTFPEQQVDKFRALRRAWRGRQTGQAPRTLSGTAVHEIISEAEGPFAQPIPLGSLTAFLAEYWEQEDSDYPSPSRLKAMKMGELVEGDDCFLVE